MIKDTTNKIQKFGSRARSKADWPSPSTATTWVPISFGGLPGSNTVRSSGSKSVSLCGSSVRNRCKSTSGVGGNFKKTAPMRWMQPDIMAWNLRKWITFRPVSGSVKKFEEAIRERNSGERPNIAMLALEAIPRYFGNVLDAENNEENSL